MSMIELEQGHLPRRIAEFMKLRRATETCCREAREKRERCTATTVNNLSGRIDIFT